MTDPESKNTKGIQEVYNFLILEYFPTAHEINDQIMNLLQVHRMQSDFQPVIDQFDAFVEINNFSRGLLEINARNLLSQKIEIKQMFLDLVNSFIQFINEIRENYANVLTDDDYLHFKQSGEKLKNTSHLIIFPENPSKQKILDLFYKDNYVGNKDPNHYLDKFLMLTFFRLNCSEPKQKTFSILLTSIFKKRIDYLLNLKCYVENTDSTDEDLADCRKIKDEIYNLCISLLEFVEKNRVNVPIPTPCVEDKDYLFISYSHDDNEEVFKFIQLLQKMGYRIWFDTGVNIGDAWEKVLQSRVEKSTLVILMASNASLQSKAVWKEFVWAYVNKIDVFPINLEKISFLNLLLDHKEYKILEAIQAINKNNLSETEFCAKLDIVLPKSTKK